MMSPRAVYLIAALFLLIPSGRLWGSSALFSGNESEANMLVTPSLVGSWFNPIGGESQSAAVITFLSNGNFLIAQDGNSSVDPSGQDGMERGTYTWDSSNGAFSARVLVDTDGEWGLSHFDVTKVTVNGDTLSVNDGFLTFTRVANASNPIVGGWHISYGPNGSNAAIITFLENGEYFMADDGDSFVDPSGRDGMERGTFTWNAETGAFTHSTSVDTTGEWGLSHVEIPSASISGDQLTLMTSDGAIPFSRVVRPTPPPTGVLQVTIVPPEAVIAGAKWSVDGVSFHDSGSSVTLPEGSHSISFREVTGWSTPASHNVTITTGETATVSASYLQPMGSLRVEINPPEAISAGAQWRADTGEFLNSGSIVNLPIGTHSISFREIPGWIMPASQTVSIAADQRTDVAVMYLPSVRLELRRQAEGKIAAEFPTSAGVQYKLQAKTTLAPGTAWSDFAVLDGNGSTASIDLQSLVDGNVSAFLRLAVSSAKDGPPQLLVGKTLQLVYASGAGERIDFTSETTAIYEQMDPFIYTWDRANARIVGQQKSSSGTVLADFDIRLTFDEGSSTRGTAQVTYTQPGGTPLIDPGTFTLLP